MNEGTLLAFGCVVTFIAFSAAYIYITGGSAIDEESTDLEPQSAEPQKAKTGA